MTFADLVDRGGAALAAALDTGLPTGTSEVALLAVASRHRLYRALAQAVRVLTFADSAAPADIGLLARDPVAAFARQLRDAAPRRALPDDLPPPLRERPGTDAAELLAEAATYYGAAADLLATHLNPDGELASDGTPHHGDPQMGWAALAALADAALAATALDDDLVRHLPMRLPQRNDRVGAWAAGVAADAARTARGGLAYTANIVIQIADAQTQAPTPTYQPAGALGLHRPNTLAEAPAALRDLVAVLDRDPLAVTQPQLARLSLDLGEIAGLSSRLLYAAGNQLPAARPEIHAAVESLLRVTRAWRDVRVTLGRFHTAHQSGTDVELPAAHIVRLLHTTTRHRQGWRQVTDVVPDATAAAHTLALTIALADHLGEASAAFGRAVTRLQSTGRLYAVNGDADDTRPELPLWVPCSLDGPYRSLAERLDVVHHHSVSAKHAGSGLGCRIGELPTPGVRLQPRSGYGVSLAASSRPSAPWSRPQDAARAVRRL